MPKSSKVNHANYYYFEQGLCVNAVTLKAKPCLNLFSSTIHISLWCMQIVLYANKVIMSIINDMYRLWQLNSNQIIFDGYMNIFELHFHLW